jgi:hypothetical protein
MADITWEDAEAHYPALSSVSEEAQADLLAFVNGSALSASVFGGVGSAKYRLARVHYLAHLVEAQTRGGASGPIASKTISAESLSVSYASSAASQDVLLTTAGGAALRQLIRSSPGARIMGGRR